MNVHDFQSRTHWYEHKSVNDHGVKQNLECFRLHGPGATCLKVVIIELKSSETIISINYTLAMERGAIPYAQALLRMNLKKEKRKSPFLCV